MSTFNTFDLFGGWTLTMERVNKPKQVIFNPPYTIVVFDDGSKSIVKCHNEEFDYEKGLMAAICKKVMTRSDFERMMNKGIESLDNKQKKTIENKE
jgi:hypothetical protein